MVPYRGRLALRIARIALALACLIWYYRAANERFPSLLAILAAYLVYAAGVMFELRLDSPVRAKIALVADAAFFGFWSWIVGLGWVAWPAAGWMSTLLCAYLLTSAVVLHDLAYVSAVAGLAAIVAVVFAPHGEVPPMWVTLAVRLSRSRWHFTSAIWTGDCRTRCVTT